MKPSKIAERGRQIYRERLKDELERTQMGKCVAIDITTGRYFLGETPYEALRQASAAFPKSIFHVMRVGAKGVLHLNLMPNDATVRGD